MLLKSEKINGLHVKVVGRDSSVGTVSRYGLSGPGIKSRCGLDFLHSSRMALGPTQPLIQCVPRLYRGKATGGGVDHPPNLAMSSKEE